jgi:predicted transcriptional regulator of viral defense system
MAKVTINDALSNNDPLSRREVRLLSGWERERRQVVTIHDLRERVGNEAAAEVARKLIRKGALQRLRRGSYLVRPFRTLGRASGPSTPVMVEALLREEPHYLGGLWAVSFHGLTEQRYAAVMDAFVTHRLRPRPLGAGRVRFHVLARNAFSYGIDRSEIEGMTVHHSDRERTLLDALDHPRIFGGLQRALEMVRAQLRRLDRRQLLRYAIAGSKPGTCQRLGVLLERAGMSARALAPLRARARRTRSLLSMNPEAPRTGRVNRRWSVVENDR